MVGGPGGIERLLKVTVLEIRGGYVRLGFEADATIPIHRSEVWKQIHDGGSPDVPGARPSYAGRLESRQIRRRLARFVSRLQTWEITV